MNGEIKYPNIKVKLSGTDGNAFALIGKVKQALIKGKVQQEQVNEFVTEAMSGNYNNLLVTCMKWVEVR